MITWTIGSGGLLGAAVNARSPKAFPGSPVPWSDPDEAVAVLTADLERFREAGQGEDWAIVWAAGAATVSSTSDETAGELAVLQGLLRAIVDRPLDAPGVFFLTSSAGGVYAGSSGAPFDVDSAAVPLSAYGELKLHQEATALLMLEGVCAVLVGRVSNLYGPGQNLAKLQGLISRLALAAATRQPLNIFVSLDTLRDYIYVDDAALAITRWIQAAVESRQTEPELRIIASGEAVTVGQLISTMRLVTKRKIPLALGTHSSAQNQVLDLRLSPTCPLSDQGIALTPLPVGAKQVFLDIVDRVQHDTSTEQLPQR